MVSRRGFLRATGGTTTLFLAGCLDEGPDASPGTDATTDWPMARADSANSAYVKNAKAPRKGVSERWTAELAPGVGPPAVVDDTVYFSTRGALVALDSKTGTERWRFAPVEAPTFSSPIVYEGRVYTTVRHEGVYALDAKTGTKQWKRADEQEYTALSFITGQLVDHPWLVAGTASGTVFRLDPQTGKQTWQTDLFGEISAFGFGGQTLYIGTTGGEIFSFITTEDTTREGWRQSVGSAVRTLVPTSEGIAVHTFGGPLRLLQSGLSAGTTRWSIDSKLSNSAPVHARFGQTFYTAGYGRIAAVRDHSGKPRWRVGGQYNRAGPVAAGDTLYVSSGKAVYAFALDGGVGIGTLRTGAKRWSHSTENSIDQLAIGDGALFASCDTVKEAPPTMYCLEPA